MVSSYHTSHSLAARVAQHEDDWERVSNMFVILEFVIHRSKTAKFVVKQSQLGKGQRTEYKSVKMSVGLRRGHTRK